MQIMNDAKPWMLRQKTQPIILENWLNEDTVHQSNISFNTVFWEIQDWSHKLKAKLCYMDAYK